METKLLTHEQEEKILREVLKMGFIDNGAARLVFNLDTNLQKELGINADFSCVVKVPMGIGGYNQTQLEIKTFLESGSVLPLAQIVAYGRYIEIMEKVEPEDYRDFYDDYEDADDYMENAVYQRDDESDADYDRRYQEIYDDVSDACAVMDQLNDYFGQTADNGQIGKNRDGYYVAYDYGYLPGSRSTQVSDLEDALYDDDAKQQYILGLIDILRKEENLLEYYEQKFLNDENGDDTYTRYEAVSLVEIPENRREWWDGNQYMKNDNHAKNLVDLYCYMNNGFPVRAFEVKEVVYDIYNKKVKEQVVDKNIPLEYFNEWQFYCIEEPARLEREFEEKQKQWKKEYGYENSNQ